MDPTLLRAFVAVVDEHHFRRAATRLNLAPSTVSEQISKLERLAGARLLHRNPVELTPAGERLLTVARQAVRMADTVNQRVEDIRTQPKAVLRIGVLSHGAGARMADLIRTYRIEHPEVQVSLVSLAFSDMASSVLDGAVDVAFIRPSLRDPRLEEHRLMTEQRCAILPRFDERAHLPSLSHADLDRDTFLSPSRGAPTRYGAFLHLLDDRNDENPRTLDTGCDRAEEFLVAVAAGVGIATTVASFAHYYPWPGVSYVPLHDATPASTSLVVAEDDQRRAVRSFVELAS